MKYIALPLVFFLTACNQENPQAMVAKQPVVRQHHHQHHHQGKAPISGLLPQAAPSIPTTPTTPTQPHEHHHPSVAMPSVPPAMPKVTVIPKSNSHEHGHG